MNSAFCQEPLERRLLEYGMAPGKVEAFSTFRDSELPYFVVTGHQVHGTRVAVVTDPATGREELEGYDALITRVKGCAIGVRTADCIPVLLFDPVHKAVAAVHSGWRGTVARISAKAITRMHDVYGTAASDLIAVIGPGISADSFQVGPEVVDAFRDAGFDMERIWSSRGPKTEGSMAGGEHIDLWEAVRLTLIESGITATNIKISGIDTYTDTRFYSARREGTACGRIINAIRVAR